MDQQTKDQYIAELKSASWQDIKDEADKYGIEKETDEKWKDLIPAIADAKFADPVVKALTEEEKDFLEPELVKEELPPLEVESDLSFDYIKEGGALVCPVCNYQIRTGMDLKTKICPVANPACPRPKGD
jgi:hypothetical protein